MSGALDPIQEDLPFDGPSSPAPTPVPHGPPSGPIPPALSLGAMPPTSMPERPEWASSTARSELRPSLFDQLRRRLATLPWATWRLRASAAARDAVVRGSTVARVAVKRGTPYTVQLAKATAQISLIRAFPLMVARTIHLFGFPAVVLRTAIQFTIAHRSGLSIDEVVYFRVDDPAGYTVYEAPSRLGTAIAITYLPALVLWILSVICLAPALAPHAVLHLATTWLTWVQVWLGLSFAAHALPSYEEAGPVAEQARLGVVKADPISVFWVIPAQAVAILARFGGIVTAVAGGAVGWWLASALFH